MHLKVLQLRYCGRDSIIQVRIDRQNSVAQFALITTSAYRITISFKATGHARGALESPGSDVPRESIGKKGSRRGRQTEVKIELVSQPVISYRFRY